MQGIKTINRSAFIIRPKEPYLRWAAGVDGAAAADTHVLRGRTSVYLVPEDPDGAEETPPLADYFEDIFTSELLAWCRDSTAWPRERNLEMFRDWFEVSGQSVVVDLRGGRLKHEKS